jgi:histidine triad (HIT) family protein
MCIFCKIVNKELEAKILAENNLTLAFLDIKPVKPGHVLVVAKRHIATIEELSLEESTKLMELIKIMGERLKEKLKIKGYNLILNNGKVAGQEIDHLHFHLIPRHENDGLNQWPRQEYKNNELDLIYQKLKI